MADDVDNAQRHIDAELSAALAVRKPVPTRCECGEPCVVLPNGARARFCPARDRWAVIDGDRMRMLMVDEARRAMTFPASYVLPANSRTAMHMLGNAVPPLAAQRVIEAMRAAA